MKRILFFDATNQWILVESFHLNQDGELETVASYSGIHPRESSKLLIQELQNVLKNRIGKLPI